MGMGRSIRGTKKKLNYPRNNVQHERRGRRIHLHPIQGTLLSSSVVHLPQIIKLDCPQLHSEVFHAHFVYLSLSNMSTPEDNLESNPPICIWYAIPSWPLRHYCLAFSLFIPIQRNAHGTAKNERERADVLQQAAVSALPIPSDCAPTLVPALSTLPCHCFEYDQWFLFSSVSFVRRTSSRSVGCFAFSSDTDRNNSGKI